MADAQTTGGYPRIGQVAAVDLHLAAQKPPGSTIHFKKISLSDAETLLFEREKQLLQLKRDYYLYFS
jgi:antagonist of KipI